MGYIHCCGGLRKTKNFVLSPVENFILCELDYLPKCPVCGHTILQLTRIDSENNISSIRYKNKAAKKYLKKFQSQILYENKYIDYSNMRRGNFYLNYNEFGVKKRCYSNLSRLKIGLNSTF